MLLYASGRFPVFGLTALVMLLPFGCGLSYTRAKRNELITPEQGPVVAHRMDTNEILATDSSGLVCSGVATNLSAYAGAQGAVNKMARDGTREEEFTYRRYSNEQFVGVQCGAYYRWSTGTNIVSGDPESERPRDVWGRTDTKEVGFHMEGSESLYKDLFYTARFRFGGGKVYEDKASLLIDGTRILLPLDLGLSYAPPFLFGVGAKAYVGYDVLNLVVEPGAASEKFNYGMTGFYRAGLGKLGFGLEGGWRHESVATTDPGTWVEADEYFGTLWAMYDFF